MLLAVLLSWAVAGCTVAPSPTVIDPSPTLAGSLASTPSATTTPVVEIPPHTITLDAAGYSARLSTMALGKAPAIDPPNFSDIFAISDLGALPSRAATNTVYVACHTNANASAADVPCNLLSDHVSVGDVIRVRSDGETLTYRVTHPFSVLRTALATNAEVWAVHPGRLVWITCYLEDGHRSAYNLVIVAELQR